MMSKQSKQSYSKNCYTTINITEDTKGDSNHKFVEENLKNNKDEYVEKNSKDYLGVTALIAIMG